MRGRVHESSMMLSRYDRISSTTLFVRCKIRVGKEKMACIYLGYVSSRISYRCLTSPRCYFSFASISSRLSRPPGPSRCSLSRVVLAYAVFPFFILLAGCYSMPTTPPTFFFISIRVLRAICYDPTNPRG